MVHAVQWVGRLVRVHSAHLDRHLPERAPGVEHQLKPLLRAHHGRAVVEQERLRVRPLHKRHYRVGARGMALHDDLEPEQKAVLPLLLLVEGAEAPASNGEYFSGK